MLNEGTVLEVDPGGGDIESHIAGDDLDATFILSGFPVGRGDIDGVCPVFEAKVDRGFDPGGGVGYGSATEEPIGETEVIIPAYMVRSKALEVGAGCDALRVGACAYI